MIHAFEPLVSHLAADTPFRAAFAAAPEATLTTPGLALTDAERELVQRLRTLLALPADVLLQRLLGDGPPRWWDVPPFPAQTAVSDTRRSRFFLR